MIRLREGGSGMENPTTDKDAFREQLRRKRNKLFETYSKNPTNTHLAIEIKLTDDEIADLTADLAREKMVRRHSG
jgi:hypothetical protein